MNDRQKKALIAGKCGWTTEAPNWASPCHKDGSQFWFKKGYNARVFGQLPDYLNDLNAMHEAENCLDEQKGEINAYLHALEMEIPVSGILRRKSKQELQIISATCKQRANAFLRVINTKR